MFLMVSALGGGGNELGTIVKYISYGVLALALAKPRFGFWASIFCMGYIDFIKRLLVLGGSFNFGDVTILLAFPPILCYCTFIGILVKKFFARDFSKKDVSLLALWFVLSMVLGIMSLGAMKNGGLAFLQSAANFVGYVPLVFIVPNLFRSDVAILKTLKTMVLLFIPIPLYAIYQKHVGFMGFEIDYLMTGYSLESRILAGQDFRYFSTLNSSQNLAKFASMFAVVALFILPRYQTQNEYFRGFGMASRITLYLLFAYAGIISGARTGVLMGMVAIPAYFILRSRLLTISSYIFGFCSFIFVVSISSYVVESKILNYWTSVIESKMPDWLDLNVNLSTLTIRFEGFSHWSNPDFWKPIGHSFSDPDYSLTFPSHDMITYFMLSFGYVPMTMILVIGGFLMLKFHHKICRREMYHKNLYLCLAIVVCILFGCLTTSNLSTYPINLILYTFIGFIIVSARSSVEERKREQELKD